MSSAHVAIRARQGNVVALIGRAMRWRLPLILLIAVPMSAAALWELDRQPDVYEAVTVLSISPRAGEPASSDLLRLSAQRYAVTVGSGATLSAVAERTGLRTSDLRSQADISVPTETANIRIVVRMRSALQAARVANLLGAEGESRGSSDGLVLVQITSAAQVPQQPASPPRTLIAALVLLVAVGSGLAAAMLLERLRPRLRSQKDIVTVMRAPVLGVLPRSALAAGPLVSALDDDKIGAAARALRTRFLAQRATAGLPRSIAVTSVESGSSGIAVSTLLGLALARGGLRTAFVDADPATDGMVERLERDAAAVPGMLVDDVPPGLACTYFLSGRLVVVSTRLDEPARDRLAGALPKLLSNTAQLADLVLVDAPPLLDDIAGSAVVTHVDAVLLVVTRGSSANACRAASDQLADLGVRVLGSVVIEARGPRRRVSRAASTSATRAPTAASMSAEPTDG